MSHYTLRKAIHIPNTPTSKGQSSKPATLLRLKKNTQKKKNNQKTTGGAGQQQKSSLHHTIHYSYTVYYIWQSQTLQKIANGHLILNKCPFVD